MNTNIERIGENARVLRDLYARIYETLSHRSDNAAARSEWQQACAAFHQSYDDLAFPGGSAALDALSRGDLEAVDSATLVLAADPWFFRSGYLKEYLWRQLKRQPLSDAQLARVESAGFAYLKRRVEREFWHMLNFMVMRARPSFWERLDCLAEESNESVRSKAQWLLLGHDKWPIRSWVTREVWRAKSANTTPNLAFKRTRRKRRAA